MPVTDIRGDKGYPSIPFHIWWQKLVKAIETSINDITDALEAAGIAIAAADAAQAAADDAQAAATAAQAAAESAGTTSKLSGSGVSGCTITASDAGGSASIAVSAHTRNYSDGSSVAVNSHNYTGLAYSTTYYMYYDDPDFTGGAVSYQITTTQGDAIQTGARHLVGKVTTPAALGANNGGSYTAPPGHGQLQEP